MQERPSLLMHSAMVQSKVALPISLVTSMLIIILACPKDGHMDLSTVPTSLLAFLESVFMLVHRKYSFSPIFARKKVSFGLFYSFAPQTIVQGS